MLIVFALDRIRMEVVALGGLGLGVALGLVPPVQAFAGFSHPAFITVVEILLIVQVLGHSAILDAVTRRIPVIAPTEIRVLTVLCLLTATLSVFMNNIGALALMLPVVTSVCRVTALDSRRILMPVSFAALLGGLCSVIGTPANLIVSSQLADATGTGFTFFDFAWVGVPAALAGLLVIVTWPRRILGSKSTGAGRSPPQSFRTVVSEVQIGPRSPLAGTPAADTGLTIHAMRRAGENILFQRRGTRIEAGDTLLIEIGLQELEEGLASGAMLLPKALHSSANTQRVEAVIMPESVLVGSRIGALEGLASRGIGIIAVATHTPRIEGSLADLQLSIGDVLYLTGDPEAIGEAVEEADILPLWPKPQSEAAESHWAPILAFAGGVTFAAFGLAPPELAFGLVVFFLAATGSLNLRKGLAALDWPILIMLATMIPLGLAVGSTGAASVLAGGLMTIVPGQSALVLSVALLFVAVVITPFVNNASTAIILGPIALGAATAAGIAPEPLLLAVALGASIDFLTPIGHHNNTIVMGLAGYRFVDFIKVGWPVTIAVIGAATLALRAWWA
ncbi:di/tricarboxylate transporter [Aurantimonas endophytica]|uniref:Di/tricarboxylate transporter n=2 Tax=Aurantimonas endophytica TaxID=1522175 RepID=A0A7W6HBH4_9HYPH|nr:SLC13 family permease [Aurantimonas endophytica]MBB4002155.1 di/tricarboxylate transporter [Aurantimonas endophytica]